MPLSSKKAMNRFKQRWLVIVTVTNAIGSAPAVLRQLNACIAFLKLPFPLRASFISSRLSTLTLISSKFLTKSGSFLTFTSVPFVVKHNLAFVTDCFRALAS